MKVQVLLMSLNIITYANSAKFELDEADIGIGYGTSIDVSIQVKDDENIYLTFTHSFKDNLKIDFPVFPLKSDTNYTVTVYKKGIINPIDPQPPREETYTLEFKTQQIITAGYSLEYKVPLTEEQTLANADIIKLYLERHDYSIEAICALLAVMDCSTTINPAYATPIFKPIGEQGMTKIIRFSGYEFVNKWTRKPKSLTQQEMTTNSFDWKNLVDGYYPQPVYANQKLPFWDFLTMWLTYNTSLSPYPYSEQTDTLGQNFYTKTLGIIPLQPTGTIFNHITNFPYIQNIFSVETMIEAFDTLMTQQEYPTFRPNPNAGINAICSCWNKQWLYNVGMGNYDTFLQFKTAHDDPATMAWDCYNSIASGYNYDEAIYDTNYYHCNRTGLGIFDLSFSCLSVKARMYYDRYKKERKKHKMPLWEMLRYTI